MPHTKPTAGLHGDNTPIVVFFGQTTCGKTTTLVRLIKYLDGYIWKLCETFHNIYYPGIEIDAANNFFKQQLNAHIDKVKGNEDFFLCNLYKKDGSRLIPTCRFLESPGENLFSVSGEASRADDTNADNNGLSKYQYFLDILATEYKVIWVFFMDPDFIDEQENRINTYIGSINEIAAKREKHHDSFIFLANRKDVIWRKLTKFYKAPAQNFVNDAEDYINKTFGNILKKSPYTTRGLFGSSNKHYRALYFQSFEYRERGLDYEGNQQNAECGDGSDEYPSGLWTAIQDAIDNKY